ncbi:DUF2514 domain-containing protein [Pseudomonas sp.]|uniref:DUF2514 domain-containing protein n=1 Tax=Pseudomonas sp. TaxID=306 RepID=UPI0028A17810|nr:DUF2514 domain-containing protein [Pseudomonas sp.]
MNAILLKWGIAAAIVIGCLFGAYQHGVNVTDAKWEKQQSDAQAAQATLRAQEERTARETEQRRQAEIESIRADAQKQIQNAQADARDADLASERLRKQADRLAQSVRSCPSDTGTADGGKTAPSPAMVLSDVLGRMDARARELAEAYDRSRIAGSACAAAYDAIRNNQ